MAKKKSNLRKRVLSSGSASKTAGSSAKIKAVRRAVKKAEAGAGAAVVAVETLTPAHAPDYDPWFMGGVRYTGDDLLGEATLAPAGAAGVGGTTWLHGMSDSPAQSDDAHDVLEGLTPRRRTASWAGTMLDYHGEEKLDGIIDTDLSGRDAVFEVGSPLAWLPTTYLPDPDRKTPVPAPIVLA